jgi:hypothetical protein
MKKCPTNITQLYRAYWKMSAKAMIAKTPKTNQHNIARRTVFQVEEYKAFLQLLPVLRHKARLLRQWLYFIQLKIARFE